MDKIERSKWKNRILQNITIVVTLFVSLLVIGTLDIIDMQDKTIVDVVQSFSWWTWFRGTINTGTSQFIKYQLYNKARDHERDNPDYIKDELTIASANEIINTTIGLSENLDDEIHFENINNKTKTFTLKISNKISKLKSKRYMFNKVKREAKKQALLKELQTTYFEAQEFYKAWNEKDTKKLQELESKGITGNWDVRVDLYTQDKLFFGFTSKIIGNKISDHSSKQFSVGMIGSLTLTTFASTIISTFMIKDGLNFGRIMIDIIFTILLLGGNGLFGWYTGKRTFRTQTIPATKNRANFLRRFLSKESFEIGTKEENKN